MKLKSVDKLVSKCYNVDRSLGCTLWVFGYCLGGEDAGPKGSTLDTGVSPPDVFIVSMTWVIPARPIGEGGYFFLY